MVVLLLLKKLKNYMMFIIDTKKINYSTLKMGFLEDQRHWIFPPNKITIFGLKNNKWELITSKKEEHLTENYDITTKNWEFNTTIFSNFVNFNFFYFLTQQIAAQTATHGLHFRQFRHIT